MTFETLEVILNCVQIALLIFLFLKVEYLHIAVAMYITDNDNLRETMKMMKGKDKK